jgi:hypothetical protein
MIVRGHPRIERGSTIAHGTRKLDEGRSRTVAAMAGDFEILSAQFQILSGFHRGEIFGGGLFGLWLHDWHLDVEAQGRSIHKRTGARLLHTGRHLAVTCAIETIRDSVHRQDDGKLRKLLRSIFIAVLENFSQRYATRTFCILVLVGVFERLYLAAKYFYAERFSNATTLSPPTRFFPLPGFGLI